MIRYLAILVILGAAIPAWAANPQWMAYSAPLTSCSFAPGATCSFEWTTVANANSTPLNTAGLRWSCRLEPQKSGADTTATADIYVCTSFDGDANGTADTTACTALQWDTDADGIVDDNTLDASNAMKIGTPVFSGVPSIYVDPTANPASGTAEVVCSAEVN